MTFKIPLFKVRMNPNTAYFVSEVLDSGHIAQGPKVDMFERDLAEYFEVPHEHVVTVNSGTSALHLAYHLAGIKPGDVVIATQMTCAATITPLVHLGAEIVWADVDPLNGNINPQSVAEIMKIQKAGGAVRAVVAVDWAGDPAPYHMLRDFVPRHIPIIEDAAHAFGARIGWEWTIALDGINTNRFVCYSFQAIKHLTTGDGGALVCPTLELAERARKLRWFGLDRRSSKDFRCAQDISEAGYKFHMNDIAAAIGIANIHLAKDSVRRCRQIAERYSAAFSDRSVFGPITAPAFKSWASYWLYTILVDNRTFFQKCMAEMGIETSQVHRRNDEHSAFPNRSPVSLSGLDHFSAHQVSIPCGWWMTDSDVEYVIDQVRSWSQV